MELLETFYTRVVPIFLITVMVGMGLTLTLRHLRDVFAAPRAMLTGLTAQMLGLPLIAITLGFVFQSPPVIAAGAVILSACPGGVTSNAYTFASRADTALSVSLTTVTSLITVVTIPLVTLLAMKLHFEAADIPAIPAGQMMLTLAKLTVIPIAVGMTFRAIWPTLAQKVIEPLRTATLWLLILIVVYGTWSAWDTIRENFFQAGLLMIAINLAGMGLGYLIGRWQKLPLPQRVTIMFEVGVQNLSMALLVTMTLLQRPDLAIATLVYALFMKVSAMSLVAWMRRRQGRSQDALTDQEIRFSTQSSTD